MVTDVSHGKDGVLASVPDCEATSPDQLCGFGCICAILTSFDVDVLGQVPDLFISDECVIIGGMHDTGVVELSGMIP